MNSWGTNAPSTAISVVLIGLAALLAIGLPHGGWLLARGLPAALVRLSLLMAQQWEKAVVLRFGRLHAIRGPGMFMIVPFIDSVTTWIDQRIQTTQFNAEQALTRDTVPVNIDAILFWQVHDAERAALEITDYHQAILSVA
jgi:regulator of protease activity HflC (stomatin/prohibitin superfamily)